MNAPTPRPRRASKKAERQVLLIPPCYRCGHRGTPDRPLMLERKTGKWRCAWRCMQVEEAVDG
jgi:hypothetical protein